MPSPKKFLLASVLLGLGTPVTAIAQQRPEPATLLKAQRDALASLAFLDGLWRGPGWILLPSGARDSLTQTERVGPFLDGAVKVIEGRGYTADATSRSTRSAPSRTICRSKRTLSIPTPRVGLGILG